MTLQSTFNRLLLGCLTLTLCASALAFAFNAQDTTLGRAYYDGQSELMAQVLGHDEPLPPAAARCINCHEGSNAPGPELDARLLLQPTARRGGPPSRYDEASFCRAVSEGVDAAWVQLPREMPRYALGATECRALWAYLSQR
jgi:hypothetical protein